MLIRHKVYCYQQADSCWLSSQCDRPEHLSLCHVWFILWTFVMPTISLAFTYCMYITIFGSFPTPGSGRGTSFRFRGSQAAVTSTDFLHKRASVIPQGDTWDVAVQDNLPLAQSCYSAVIGFTTAATTSQEQSHPRNLLYCTWGQRTLQGRQRHPKTSSSSLAQTTWRSRVTKVVWNVLTPLVCTCNTHSWTERTRWPT